MRPLRPFTLLAVLTFGGFSCAFATDDAPNAPLASPTSPYVLNVFTSAANLSNGVQVKSNNAILEVRALSDDVIRVRVGLNGQMPEDASWAVSTEIRQRSITVTSESDADAVGFRTGSLRIKIARQDLHLSIMDLTGNVLQEDAPGWPVIFHGQNF